MGGDQDRRCVPRRQHDDDHVVNTLGICRDSKGISELPQIQLILPYKISCIRGSSEIPLLVTIPGYM